MASPVGRRRGVALVRARELDRASRCVDDVGEEDGGEHTLRFDLLPSAGLPDLAEEALDLKLDPLGRLTTEREMTNPRNFDEARRRKALRCVAAMKRAAGHSLAPQAGYGWTQPGGYQVVTGGSPCTIEDAPLVHGGPVCLGCVEAAGTPHSSRPTTTSNTSFRPTFTCDHLLSTRP